MKTFDYSVVIEKIFSERNTLPLTQVHSTSLTIEPLLTLLGIDDFTSFTSSLLSETIDLLLLLLLQLTPNIREYLKKMKEE